MASSHSLFASVSCDSGLGGGQAVEPSSRSMKHHLSFILSGKSGRFAGVEMVLGIGWLFSSCKVADMEESSWQALTSA